VFVATPQLLATYGITASQIAPGTDILTMRPGMAGLPNMIMFWNGGGPGGFGGGPGGGGRLPACTLANDRLPDPVMRTTGNLPSGTSAPNTVITEYAVSTYHLRPHLAGWLIQAPGGLNATQVNAARQLAAVDGVTVETKSGELGLGEIADGATALGIVIALGVLAMSVGLIRSETRRDLRTLAATGASSWTRRTITAATAGALGLLGAVLGVAGAAIAGLAWARSSLSVTFGDVPLDDIVILLIGLPLVAALGGWLLAGREPEIISRQPMD
jgi:putative ABC transport system permease protein